MILATLAYIRYLIAFLCQLVFNVLYVFTVLNFLMQMHKVMIFLLCICIRCPT
uniref:Uncharacterized protein n=1 Tax=Myoviridae sp. ctFPV8 TaxID=2825068 RepID=A0A8S5PC84_9CAUD|nr:MAG TPA: hypothetical protein [Myoviridae sp. ctFPV8]